MRKANPRRQDVDVRWLMDTMNMALDGIEREINSIARTLNRQDQDASGFIAVKRPAGAVDIEEIAAADYALEQALEQHNYAPLIERLRTAAILMQAERELAAAILDGSLKRPAHRVAKNDAGAASRDLLLAASVAEIVNNEGAQHKSAVPDVAGQHGVSEKLVRDAVRKHPQIFSRGLPKRPLKGRSGK